ncbi:MAG: hypothetical protein JWM07_347 [Candidatus Saccharibacteria bacterium]|nr:hypothetical protein [Candidatus Saccharibacteria bacterium]
MKQLLSNKYTRALATVVIACLISVLAQTWKTVDNVPFCVNSAGCNFSIEPKGQITDRNYGYPLTYKQTSTFIPEHNNQNDAKYAGYAEATTERQPFNWYNILINTIFWSSVLFTFSRFITDIKGTRNNSSVGEHPTPMADSVAPPVH